MQARRANNISLLELLLGSLSPPRAPVRLLESDNLYQAGLRLGTVKLARRVQLHPSNRVVGRTAEHLLCHDSGNLLNSAGDRLGVVVGQLPITTTGTSPDGLNNRTWKHLLRRGRQAVMLTRPWRVRLIVEDRLARIEVCGVRTTGPRPPYAPSSTTSPSSRRPYCSISGR